MQRDWQDFKALHGSLAGARDAFEPACESLFRKLYPNKNVKTVAVKKGDGGIDIFIGELGVKPITVIQCKFFLDSFAEVQQAQVRESFKTAIEATEYELKDWILCVPRELPIDETSWWSKWKSKMVKQYNKSDDFISLKTGNELIELMKVHGIYNTLFQIEDSLLIKDTNDKVSTLSSYLGIDVDSDDLTIIDEICDYVLANIPKKVSTHKEITNSSSFAKIQIKVPLNFPVEHRNRIAELLKNTWNKRQIVGEYLSNLEDEVHVIDLKERIQQDYCQVRGVSNPQEPIEDVKFIDELSQKILPTRYQSNLHYQTNAKAIILYFFEFCDIGQKTDTENQLSFNF
jgi:Restriction endonuclease